MTLAKINDVGSLDTDKRGHHGKQKTIDHTIKEQIRNHINSFERIEAHYVRKDSKRQYLDPNLSASKMYRMYKEWCTENDAIPGKEWLYLNIFSEEFNIGFHIPKKDQCDFCEKYKHSTAAEQEQQADKKREHLANKDLVRKLKEWDAKNPGQNTRAAVFDLQRVLPCPTGQASMLYYSRKLSVFNFTIFELAVNKGKQILWHEGIASRGANDIASCVFDYLKEKADEGVAEVTFYSDCCGGQNRN